MKILSHNVYWFQGAPFGSTEPGAPQAEVLRHLAALYHTAKPDLLCLQEIQSPAPFRMLSQALNWEGAYCPGQELGQYGGVVLWPVNAAALVRDASTARLRPQRMWQLIKVPLADKAVYFCNVHLPSDKQMGAKEADERRIREVRAILGLDPRPDVVLGDLNEEPDGALGGVLGEAGYVDAAAHVDSAGQMTTLDGHRKDQIWVREELATRLSGYGLLGRQQLETDLPEKKYLSDHLGVYIEIDL